MGVYLGETAVAAYVGGVNSTMFATEKFVNESVAEVVAVNETQATQISQNTTAIATANSNISKNTADIAALQTTHDEDIALLMKNWGTITIPLSGWSSAVNSNGWYTNQVTVSGMSVNYNPYADVVYTSASTISDEDAAFGCIKEIETANGYILAKCTEKPTINVKVRLMGV